MTAGIILVLVALGIVVGVPMLWGSVRLANTAPPAVAYGWFALLTALMIAGLVYAVIFTLSIPL